MTTIDPHDNDQPTTLYMHDKRPRWGLALLAWDHGDRRGYQFEDGKLRVFKDGYYQLLREVDLPADRSQRAIRRLSRTLGRRESMERKGIDHLIDLDEQISYFLEQHPGGCRGDAWLEAMRGVGARRKLKRHRDPAVTRARELLSRDELDRMLGELAFEQLIQALVTVLDQTSLVSARQLRILRRLPRHREEATARALRELLHGAGELSGRLDTFAAALGDPSWQLATAPLALLDPTSHVCVTPTVFTRQAAWMAPRLEHSRRPDGATYERYLAMVQSVQKRLDEAGVAPADLLDVHDFIYETLRPAARRALAARRGAAGDEEKDGASDPVDAAA